MNKAKNNKNKAKKIMTTSVCIILSFAIFFGSYSRISAYSGESEKIDAQKNSDTLDVRESTSEAITSPEYTVDSSNSSSEANISENAQTNSPTRENQASEEAQSEDTQKVFETAEEVDQILLVEKGTGTQENPYIIDVTDTTLGGGFTITTADDGNSIFVLNQASAVYSISGGTEAAPSANSILVAADNITINLGNTFIQTDDTTRAPLNTGRFNLTLNALENTTSSFINSYASGSDSKASAGILHDKIDYASYGQLNIIGNGTIIAKGAYNGAGIGGSNGTMSGPLEIKGNVTVIATGGAYGAGIGGGGTKSLGGAVHSIEISENATVTATGGDNSAGIGGGGYNASGGKINVLGQSNVTATGGAFGAGIGGGIYSSFTDFVTLNNPTIVAKGGQQAAGIGGGAEGTMGRMYIFDNPTITATGGAGNNVLYGGGAGIGTGGLNNGITKQTGNDDMIQIEGGTIIANGANNAPGMGLAKGFTTPYILRSTINGGNIYSTGNYPDGEINVGIGSTIENIYQNVLAVEGLTTQETITSFSASSRSSYTINNAKTIVLNENGQDQAYVSVWLPASEDAENVFVTINGEEYRASYTHSNEEVGNITQATLFAPVTIFTPKTVGGYAEITGITQAVTQESEELTQSIYPADTVTIQATADANYVFESWDAQGVTLDDTKNTQANMSFVVPETAVRLTPIFAGETYPIIYELNGGENNVENPATYTYGKGVETLLPAEKSGYCFSGWYTDANFTSVASSILAEQTGEVILYAKYEKLFTISVKSEGNGSAFIKKINNNIILTDTVLSEVEAGTLVEVVAIPDTGYTFSKWEMEGIELSEEQITSQTIDFEMPEEDITMIPTFQNSVYTITYNLNGGTNNAENHENYTYGNGFTLEKSTKTGYIFTGWYTDANYTNKISAITNDMAEDITLYAQYEEIPASATPEDDSSSSSSTISAVSPKTGDSTNIILPIIAFSVSLAGLSCFVFLKTKKKK